MDSIPGDGIVAADDVLGAEGMAIKELARALAFIRLFMLSSS